MFSYLKSILNYFAPHPVDDDADDHLKADFLAEQLLDLEAKNEQYAIDQENTSVLPRDKVCFQRTGIVTFMSNEKTYILIDGMIYYELSYNSISVQLNDKIMYLAYTDADDKTIVVRIIENQGICWGDEEVIEENRFEVINHVLVGEVDQRQERFVYIKDNDLKFSLDDVESSFVPIKGDWLELSCKVQWNESKPYDISAAQVLQVCLVKPLRSQMKQAIVTAWFGEYGTCDRNIYFDKLCLENSSVPEVGSKVMVNIIESNQGLCTWRAIELIVVENKTPINKPVPKLSDDEENSIRLEMEKNVEITNPLKFDKVNIQGTAEIKLNVTNNGSEVRFINKWIILSKKKDSQVNIEPVLNRPKKLLPKETFTFTVKCFPKFLGNTKEPLVIMMKGFQARRFIDITVISDGIRLNEGSQVNCNNSNRVMNQFEKMRDVRNGFKQRVLPGEKPVKAPGFIEVRLGSFPIPEKVWSAVLGDSKQTCLSHEFKKIIDNIEDKLPCLGQDLNIHNYTDKFHNLLYLEEIQNNLCMRMYDKTKVFLIRCQEYLAIELTGLAEQRPSLMRGDKAIVKDGWDPTAPRYEGFIHLIKGDLVLMKFNTRFHEIYSGSDVSIEFHHNRSTYRRGHQAINLALSNLGPNILFPRRVCPQPYQVSLEKINDIDWFNKNLNDGQKAAVTNILLGECRPLPYCIFGPPGTGKTVTVIETILQILTTVPESRLLVATPSNSAADLITERLIEYRDRFSGSMIRIVAKHIADSDKIPEIIKPFCATLDISAENTLKSKHIVKDGVNLNCPKSFVGRHRITIGTCYTMGTLAMMGLPKGHFTHVIVDEAGQATEPEIMVPMTFVEKANAQIVLAGDPMQLGPVVISKYALEFGMCESYLSRVVKTFPYQRDYAAFKTGYDQRLITKLTDNYRSLEEVITLSSEMFYDSSLVAKLNVDQTWITNILQIVNEMFHREDASTGGIYVYGIRGTNERAQDSPSWYNPQEASMVALTTCKLYKKSITADDIGILTPYVAQIKYLRLLFDAMGLPQPKIGTVEDFQGQERRIILISTVRSAENYLDHDLKFLLGFVQNPKRLNVALTRAQVAVLLFCDPHLLSRDVLWKKVITNAIHNDKYMGCDKPEDIENNVSQE